MDLGLLELIRGGKKPHDAGKLLTMLASEPEVLQMLVSLTESAEGRELLEEGCRVWARFNLRAPWAELLSERAVGVGQAFES